ncbi:MAG: hypothetical protein QW641_01890 [Candidatus Aenigmatarchaeota archaeon]
MRIVIIGIFLILFEYAFSLPFITNPIPSNNTFIRGDIGDLFQINVESPTLQSAYVSIRVDDPTSVWERIPLNCYNFTSFYICNTTIPGLQALVSEMQRLLYFFEAIDNDGSSNYGDMYNPLRVIVDRTAPRILEYPINETYISSNTFLKLKAEDRISYVDPSKSYFIYEINSMNYTDASFTFIEGNTFLVNINTSSFINNQTLNVYAHICDVVRNCLEENIGTFFVDNELPTIIEVYPRDNVTIFGVQTFYVKATDYFSKIEKAGFYISNTFFPLSCSEEFCSTYFDSRSFVDKTYDILFIVYDKANNSDSVLEKFTIDNTRAAILINTTREYLSGNVKFEIIVGNIRYIKQAKMRVANQEYIMNCTDLYCYYFFNTKNLIDGSYWIFFSVLSESDILSESGMKYYIDNTPPSIQQFKVNYKDNNLEVSFIAMDENLDPSYPKAFSNDTELKLHCTKVFEKALDCNHKSTVPLGNKVYEVKVYAKDLADNEEIKSTFINLMDLEKPNKVGETLPEGENKSMEEEEKPTNIFTFVVENISRNLGKITTLVFIVTSLLFVALLISLFLLKKPKPKMIVGNEKEAIDMCIKMLSIESGNLEKEKNIIKSVESILLASSINEDRKSKALSLIKEIYSEKDLNKIYLLKKDLIRILSQ